jgi:CBS domain containing-hemolysin-like protein
MIVGLVASLVVLVLAGALRSGASSLLVTARADALRDGAEAVHGADTVARLLEDRPMLQSAIGLVHSVILVTAIVPAAWALTTVVRGWWLAAALVALTVFVLLLGDILPRSYGRTHPGIHAYRLSGLLAVAARFGRRAGEFLIEDTETEPEEDEEEVEERRLITSVLEFSDTLVREVMVPRLDMVTVGRDGTTDTVLGIVVGQGFSRIPVLGDGPDDIVGFVYAKDLLGVADNDDGPVSVTRIMRPVYFVPETKRVPDLLRDMQSRQQHMAIVVDEFGGTAGLVTIEDLLEELVGEIIDEYDTEEPLLVELDNGGYLVDGRFSVDDLGEILDVELEHDEWDTVSGLVLDLAGRVPHVGEAFEVGDVHFEVAAIQGRRVTQIRVTRS